MYYMIPFYGNSWTGIEGGSVVDRGWGGGMDRRKGVEKEGEKYWYVKHIMVCVVYSAF